MLTRRPILFICTLPISSCCVLMQATEEQEMQCLVVWTALGLVKCGTATELRPSSHGWVTGHTQLKTKTLLILTTCNRSW